MLCPLIASSLRGFKSDQEFYEGLAIGVSFSFFLFMSLIVGLGLFASDQASGRVGFYLSRPIRPWQLLVGRVVAAVVVLLAGTTLAAMPMLWLADLRTDRRPEADALVLSLWIVGLILSTAHVLAVALRLRNRWTLFDLGATAATGLLAGSIVQNLERLGVKFGAQFLVFALAGVILLATAVGVWAQLRHGGTQRRRLHAAFSLVFWSLVLAAAGYHDIRLRLTVAQDWDDVQSFADVIPSSDGSAAWLAPDLSRPVSYLYDLESGERFAVERAAWFHGDTSANWWEPTLQGRTAMWLGCGPEGPGQNLSRQEWQGCGYQVLDLDSETPRARQIPGAQGSDILSLALDPDGRRLALLTEAGLRILDVADLRPIHQIDLPGARYLFGFHKDGSLLVLVRNGTGFEQATVSPDGSSRLRPLENALWNLDSTPEFLIEANDEERWLVDSEGRRLQPLPKVLFSATNRGIVGDWVMWIAGQEPELEAVAADGRRVGPVPLEPPAPRDTTWRRQVRSQFGPALSGSGLGQNYILVSSGWMYDRPFDPPVWARFGLARLAPQLDLGTVIRDLPTMRTTRHSLTRREEQWVTYLIDLDAGQVIARLDGYRVLPTRIETEFGPEAWLVDDEQGMPYRFDPARLDPADPFAHMEPILRPPWSEGE